MATFVVRVETHLPWWLWMTLGSPLGVVILLLCISLAES
jgi:hypothetical protein